MEIKTYQDLKVWQKAMDLTVEVYNVVKFLPKFETYALSDQMRRAAVSIPLNIAEGYGRNSTRDFIRFLSIARGSQIEVETQLKLCERLDYVSKEQTTLAFDLCVEVNKMLNALIGKLSQRMTSEK